MRAPFFVCVVAVKFAYHVGMASSIALGRQAMIIPRLTIGRLTLHRPLRLPPALQPIRIAAAALPILGTSFSDVGSWIAGIWDSILKAVPKKKSSYSRKRTRQLTGKALKDIERVVPCTSCGRPKRPHMICSNCLESTSIRSIQKVFVLTCVCSHDRNVEAERPIP